MLAEGVDCFLAEYEAGRPTVWDVVTLTVEGDPIPYRLDYNGETATITTDTRADEFGSPNVDTEVCQSVERTS
ncbi:MAG: hypothetical protein ACI8Y4_002935 [Candidatus Poriferisodalaceae bacterium]